MTQKVSDVMHISGAATQILIYFQSGLSILQDLQREVRVKERVLQQSVQTLIDVVSGRDPSLSQPEQVHFIQKRYGFLK